MEKLITVKDVSERYGCSLPTARKYIRQCNPHMEAPLATYAWALHEWEASRTVVSGSNKQRKKLLRQMNAERVIVPRRRT